MFISFCQITKNFYFAEINKPSLLVYTQKTYDFLQKRLAIFQSLMYNVEIFAKGERKCPL